MTAAAGRRAVPSPSGLSKTAAAVLAAALALLALHGGGVWTGRTAAQPAPPRSAPAPQQRAEQTAAVEQMAEMPEALPQGNSREDAF